MTASTFSRFSLALAGSALIATAGAAGAAAADDAPGYVGSLDVWGCYVGNGASPDTESYVFALSALQKDGAISGDRVSVRLSTQDGTVSDAAVEHTVDGSAVLVPAENIRLLLSENGLETETTYVSVDVLVDGRLEASHNFNLEHEAIMSKSMPLGCSDDRVAGAVRQAWALSFDGESVAVASAEEGVTMVDGPAFGSVAKGEHQLEDGRAVPSFIYTPNAGASGIETLTFEYVNEDGDLVRKLVTVDVQAGPIPADFPASLGSDPYPITGRGLDGSLLPELHRWITVPAEKLGTGEESPAEDEAPAEAVGPEAPVADEPAADETVTEEPAEDEAPTVDEQPPAETPAVADAHEVPAAVETGTAPTQPWLLGAATAGVAVMAGLGARLARRGVRNS